MRDSANDDLLTSTLIGWDELTLKHGLEVYSALSECLKYGNSIDLLRKGSADDLYELTLIRREEITKQHGLDLVITSHPVGLVPHFVKTTV